MHKESIEQMTVNLSKYVTSPTNIIDVGSMMIKAKKGSYRQIIPEGYTYVGVDTREGPNVDVVMAPDKIPFSDNNFGAVISGQCFEHVENPFTLIKECARVLKPGGYFIGVAPFVFYEHRYPVDCWRILPDGWVSLFKSCRLEPVHTYLYAGAHGGLPAGIMTGTRIHSLRIDCWGIAKK